MCETNKEHSLIISSAGKVLGILLLALLTGSCVLRQSTPVGAWAKFATLPAPGQKIIDIKPAHHTLDAIYILQVRGVDGQTYTCPYIDDEQSVCTTDELPPAVNERGAYVAQPNLEIAKAPPLPGGQVIDQASYSYKTSPDDYVEVYYLLLEDNSLWTWTKVSQFSLFR